MKIDCSRQTCAMNGVAISQWCGYFIKWCGYFIMVWLFHFGVAIYENGVAISFSISRAPCRSQKESEHLTEFYPLDSKKSCKSLKH